MIKAGSRLASATSTAQVVVVRAPNGDFDLRCAGERMMDPTPPMASPVDAGEGEQLLIGKRYVDEESGLEVLCTHAGVGPLTCGDRQLTLKSAKPLPSSD